ncbi:hypothetical protein Scep_029328 [Stephania cephalantha]|uniref:Uncharacterized protein n=1 Tax=Stephania cephalantha TaxID=152367 RepID=A0AAP0HFI0_9MAGN
MLSSSPRVKLCTKALETKSLSYLNTWDSSARKGKALQNFTNGICDMGTQSYLLHNRLCPYCQQERNGFAIPASLACIQPSTVAKNRRASNLCWAAWLPFSQACRVLRSRAILGIVKIKDGYNPATWMLEMTAPAVEDQLHIDFAEILKEQLFTEKEQQERVRHCPSHFL